MVIIIFLIALGILLVIADIIIVPGAMASILGIILIAIGIFRVNQLHGGMAATYTLVGVLLFLTIAGYIFYKSGAWKKFMVSEERTSKVNEIDEKSIKIGDKGNSITALRPSGNALINDVVFEVYSREFIDEETPIIVQKIKGNRILVDEG